MSVNNSDFHKLTFDEARDGIWIINPYENKIIDANKSLIKLSGYSKEELLAMPPQLISADPEGTAKIFKETVASDREIFQGTESSKKRMAKSSRLKSPQDPP